MTAPVVNISHTYADGTPLPLGWTINAVIPATPGAEWTFEGHYGGVKHIVSGTRADVERNIAAFSRPLGDTNYPEFESGYPLPDGWIIRYHADNREYVGYCDERRRFSCQTREEADRRIRFVERVEARQRWDAENAATDAVASARSAVEEATKATEVDRVSRIMRRRERFWLIAGAAAGLLVGGVGVGLVAANQAPEQITHEVTPTACWQALTDSDAVVDAYSDRIRAQGITATGPRLQALAEAAADAEKAITAYEASKAECLEFRP